MTLDDRTNLLVAQHGEVCTKTDAGRILSRDRSTIAAMLGDGRLEDACAGTMVDVRSIARYIMAPKQSDFETRLRKRRQRDGIACAWHV